MMWVAIAVAGGLGAVSRYLVDLLVTARLSGSGPWGTWAVNTSGSFAGGLVVGAVANGRLADTAAAVLALGFLGAYTTFSTAMVQTVEQLQGEGRAAGLLNLVGTLLTCIAAALVGLAITGG